MDLNDLRKEIDNIDDELIALFEKRLEIAKKIGDYKKKNSLPILDSKREKEKIEKILSKSEYRYRKYIEEIFEDIFKISKEYQKDTSIKSALIGKKLSHSYSPMIHSMFGEYDYDLLEVEEDRFLDTVKDESYNCFNVTIPYKKTAYKICDILDESAEKIGSVNTIYKKKGKLIGYNTDYYGFMKTVKDSKIDILDKKCLVLGSGGASLTVIKVLKDMGAGNIVVISRSGDNNYSNLNIHKDADIIVNATPVGMYPENLNSNIDLDIFDNLLAVYDLVYNPHRTKLILDAIERKIPSFGGLKMLVDQARVACEIFTQKKILSDFEEEVYKKVEEKTRNVVLIGMPGSGKSTVGKEMGEITGKKFVDTDELIEKKVGMSIPEIFEKYGEDYFRNIETDILKDVCKESGMIISTGGGIVERDENKNIIRQNAHVILVNRNLGKLDTENRPLLKVYTVEELYHRRKEKYVSWSDESIDIEEKILWRK